jgi:TolB-like protein
MINSKLTRAACVLPLLLLISGCNLLLVAEENTRSEHESVLINTVYAAVDSIISGQNKAPIARPKNKVKILTSSLVNLENLELSSPFGLIVAEQISSRLAQLGLATTEIKFTGKLFTSNTNGEQVMSREAKAISTQHNADLILVGSYVEGGNNVYVNLKLIRAEDSEVSSAYNFVISKGADLSLLLEKRASRSK